MSQHGLRMPTNGNRRFYLIMYYYELARFRKKIVATSGILNTT